jgi:hypothetical protein
MRLEPIQIQLSHITKPYWSGQHGAYLTLIVCWLIAFLLSQPFGTALPLQLAVLVLLLSGFHFSELLIELLNRKTPLPKWKLTWLGIYATLTLATGSLVYLNYPLNNIFPVFIIGGVIFILLSYAKMQKGIIAEWFTFAFFSFAGLLAFRPYTLDGFQHAGELGVIMSFYFGFSVFTVKARLHKISHISPLFYALFATAVLYYLNRDILSICVGLLLFLKAFPPAFANEWYSHLKIKMVGMMELITHLVFVLMLFFLFR